MIDPKALAKVNCLMASSSRVDDVNSFRMYVFKEQKKKSLGEDLFLGRPLTVAERERLMGFPEGYVEVPGK